MLNKNYELNEKIHATIINPYLTLDDFNINCELIKKYNIKNISTSLNFLRYFKKSDIINNTKINVFISYPFADLPVNFIEELVIYAKDAGANGIEYTPKFFFLAENDDESFANDIENISKSDLPITLIFNNYKLNNDKFIKAIKIAIELGIVNFQFGDGFGPTCNLIDIHPIINLLSEKSLVKIAGGIKKIEKVIEILDAGADCIGTSNFHDIFKDLK